MYKKKSVESNLDCIVVDDLFYLSPSVLDKCNGKLHRQQYQHAHLPSAEVFLPPKL
jgi:hypothetical protein